MEKSNFLRRPLARLARVRLAHVALGDRAAVRDRERRRTRARRACWDRPWRRSTSAAPRRLGPDPAPPQAVGLVCGGLMLLRARPQRMLLVATLGAPPGGALPLRPRDPAAARRRCSCSPSRPGWGSRPSACSGTRRCSRRSRRTGSRASTRTTRSARLPSIPLGLALAGPLAEAIGTRATLIGGRPLCLRATLAGAPRPRGARPPPPRGRSSCASRCSKASRDARRGARRARGVSRPLRRRAARAGRRHEGDRRRALPAARAALDRDDVQPRARPRDRSSRRPRRSSTRHSASCAACRPTSPSRPRPCRPIWATQLAARGLAPDRGWTKFSRPTADPPQASTELRVERDDRGEAFAEAATARVRDAATLFLGWLRRLPGREGWQCFVAFDGDAPAAAGALFVTRRGRLDRDRRDDSGAARQGRPERAARRADPGRGRRRLRAASSTETGAPADGQPNGSYRNIVRAGFEPQYVRRELPLGDRGLVGAHVVADHPLGREALLGVARGTRAGRSRPPARARPGISRQESSTITAAAVLLDHLGHRAVAGRDHRRPAGHRLDHHQAERLLPLDREERRARVLEQLDLLAVR